jgi:hypothetical protein
MDFVGTTTVSGVSEAAICMSQVSGQLNDSTAFTEHLYQQFITSVSREYPEFEKYVHLGVDTLCAMMCVQQLPTTKLPTPHISLWSFMLRYVIKNPLEFECVQTQAYSKVEENLENFIDMYTRVDFNGCYDKDGTSDELSITLEK